MAIGLAWRCNLSMSPPRRKAQNADPEGAAWFVKMKLANPSELDAMMDKAAYDAFVETL